MTRRSWNAYFMAIAREVATRSTCRRRQVGAVLVRDRWVLTTGYNGAPRGCHHCLDVGCLREKGGIPAGERHDLCRGLHGEQNAIIQAAVHGVSTEGATLYCTTAPCSICAKMLINAGVVRVFYDKEYPDEMATELFAEAGVEIASMRGKTGATCRQE